VLLTLPQRQYLDQATPAVTANPHDRQLSTVRHVAHGLDLYVQQFGRLACGEQQGLDRRWDHLQQVVQMHMIVLRSRQRPVLD